MTKTKEIFEKVKELKDQGKSGTKISEEIGISKERVYRIFSAIKNNFNSLIDLDNYIFTRIINPETNKPFESKVEYNNYNAKKRGFKNMSDYVEFRRLERKENGESLLKQEEFERSIQLFPTKRFERLTSEKRDYESIEENDDLEIISNKLNKIPDRHRKVLEMRYFQGNTLEQVAESLNVSHQNIQQLERKALKYIHPKNKIRKHKKIEDGELLLINILSKSFDLEYKKTKRISLKEISYFLNKIYHDGEKIRSRYVINSIRNTKFYKQRLKELKDKYFPYS